MLNSILIQYYFNATSERKKFQEKSNENNKNEECVHVPGG